MPLLSAHRRPACDSHNDGDGSADGYHDAPLEIRVFGPNCGILSLP